MAGGIGLLADVAGIAWLAVSALASFADKNFKATRTEIRIGAPVRYAGAAGDGIAVVTFPESPCGQRALCREITNVAAADKRTRVEVRLPASPLLGSILMPRGSDGFVINGKEWWYVTMNETAATTFLKSDGSRVTHTRPTAELTPGLPRWAIVPIPGQQPGALELTLVSDGILLREVGWDGPLRSWRLPRFGRLWPVMAAQRLPDHRIALFCNGAGLSMHLLSDDGGVETTVLRNLRVHQFGTAIDRAGRIAIAAARTNPDSIDAAIVDVAQPGKAQWHSIRHDVAVTDWLREVQLVATPNDFAAAWINERAGRRIEATELDASGRCGEIVDVGRAAPRGKSAFSTCRPPAANCSSDGTTVTGSTSAACRHR